MSQITSQKYEGNQIKAVTSLLKRFICNNDIYIRLESLYMNSDHIVLYSEASFAGNMDASSQIGNTILLADNVLIPHVLTYSPARSKHVVRSYGCGNSRLCQ